MAFPTRDIAFTVAQAVQNRTDSSGSQAAAANSEWGEIA